MLRFFRRLRQRLLTDNKFSKYLLYAVGEILLVVIGILIAFQVDSWNEERKSEIETSRLIGDLQDEIIVAVASRHEIISLYMDSREKLALALDKITSEPPKKLSQEECEAVAFSHYIRWSPFTLSTLDEMVTTGKISFIKDIRLRNALLDFRNNSGSNREELGQTIMEPNVLVDEFPNLVIRNWNADSQDSDFDCLSEKMNLNKKFMAQLQSNRGRMGAPVIRAQRELEALLGIQKTLREYHKSSKK
ncbi:DUF6090 family protein [Robiginitalea sp. SC105]|uniref:DUF6090 family protein n=1 Tax=Robiginitalea sp. SC105 TaxID=2762332 RepID=UPI001639B55F|nr:DUF6090 family protein [Robiginitalea sp. SC105]MBC2840096.1 hypothetical protein [Robiginitalea sp. SC105]